MGEDLENLDEQPDDNSSITGECEDGAVQADGGSKQTETTEEGSSCMTVLWFDR